MKFVPVMWTVWGVLALITAALYIYRSSLTRDEDDQLYLDDAFQQEKSAQEAIVAKVNKTEPALRVSLWAIGAMTLFVAGFYILDFINQFK
jgi:type VI protein secretion system component VasF